MKFTTALLILLFHGSTLLAQAPTIRYLQVDEEKSQLWIAGAFGSDSGSVMIEDTTLGIASWSDTMIVCNLPDKGKGSGGSVIVQTLKGNSNGRVLSIFYLTIYYTVYQRQSAGHEVLLVDNDWYINWRDEIDTESITSKKINDFEISKSSSGYTSDRGKLLPWSDSSHLADTAIAVCGTIDRTKNTIFLRKIYLDNIIDDGYAGGRRILFSKDLKFDSLGHIFGVVDSTSLSGAIRRISYFAHIGFPPSSKSSVKPKQVNDQFIFIKSITDSKIVLKTTEAIGDVVASLYTLDGKLLHEDYLNINVPGEYPIDVSGVKSQYAFLALKTAEGLIVKKVMLQ